MAGMKNGIVKEGCILDFASGRRSGQGSVDDSPLSRAFSTTKHPVFDYFRLI